MRLENVTVYKCDRCGKLTLREKDYIIDEIEGVHYCLRCAEFMIYYEPTLQEDIKVLEKGGISYLQGVYDTMKENGAEFYD